MTRYNGFWVTLAFKDFLEHLSRSTLPYHISSPHIPMDALGQLTPFCSICRQFFGFIPGSAHILQILSDNVHPVFLWPFQLPLVGYPVSSHCIALILKSSILIMCPSHLSLLFNDEL